MTLSPANGAFRKLQASTALGRLRTGGAITTPRGICDEPFKGRGFKVCGGASFKAKPAVARTDPVTAAYVEYLKTQRAADRPSLSFSKWRKARRR